MIRAFSAMPGIQATPLRPLYSTLCPASAAFPSCNYSMPPVRPFLSPHLTPSSPPDPRSKMSTTTHKIQPEGGPSTTTSPSPPTAHSACGSLASGPPTMLVQHRLLSTLNTDALLVLSITPKTRSRSLASGFQFTLRLISIPLAVWTLEKATPRYL
ncbi:hypothetical protein DFP72DRAFT_477793 [Ephemerocybe angulata]|uniref:Uncharacterized protein n=1 Tax=Ephemerocybe angulata TaxID=980116 RepID=A0A8H6IDG2_9AGAR|nr:hypothetical protein DFP72DRAFT_477793 [Tulosesus angulatus]